MNSRILKEKLIIQLALPIFNYDARKRFRKFIKPDDYILDISALSSPFTKGLANKVVAIDKLPEDNNFGFSEKTLTKLRNRLNIETKIMDAQNMTFADNIFDIVILTEVLEHIPDDIKAAKEIIRVLKPGGFLLLTVPHLERVTLKAGIKEHYRHYPKIDLIKIFGKEEIILLQDRFKFDEFIWGSIVIRKYNNTKRKIYLLLLQIGAIIKILITNLWLPLSEVLFPNRPGYNLIMVMKKRTLNKTLI